MSTIMNSSRSGFSGLDAVHKSRIQRGLGVDIGVLQKDGFDCDDPNNSIFT